MDTKFLTEKLGPLPAWTYFAIGGVGFLLLHKSSTPQPVNTNEVASSLPPAYGSLDYSGGSIGSSLGGQGTGIVEKTTSPNPVASVPTVPAPPDTGNGNSGLDATIPNIQNNYLPALGTQLGNSSGTISRLIDGLGQVGQIPSNNQNLAQGIPYQKNNSTLFPNVSIGQPIQYNQNLGSDTNMQNIPNLMSQLTTNTMQQQLNVGYGQAGVPATSGGAQGTPVKTSQKP